MSTLLPRLTGTMSIVAFVLFTLLASHAHAEGGFPPGKGAPFGRDDFMEELPNGDIILRVKIDAKLDGQTYVLSSADLKGCVELVVPDARKTPRYTPFLWDTETAFHWTGRCTGGLRDGPGELTAVDPETGETVVRKGAYANGQRTGVWESTTDGVVKQETFRTSDIPPKIASAVAALVPRLKPQPIFTERYAKARKHLAAAAKSAPAAAPPAKAAPATSPVAACGNEILVRKDDPRPEVGMAQLSGYTIASEKPLALRPRGGLLFTTTVAGAGNAGDIQWSDAESKPDTDVAGILAREQADLDREEDRISSCSNACCGPARSYCTLLRDNRAKVVTWLRCVATAAGLPVAPVRARAPAAPPPSYWGLAGSRVFLAYMRIAQAPGRDRLPLGGYVTGPILVTGPSREAVLERLNVKYRARSGHLAYVSAAEQLQADYNGPKTHSFAVLDKSCGAGHASLLIDASARDAFPGQSRLVALGCGNSPEAAMQDALGDCQRMEGCTSTYAGTILMQWEVVRWDGTKVGALAGAGGTADVSAANASIGGCGIEQAIGPRRVGLVGMSEVITEAMCRSVAAGVR